MAEEGWLHTCTDWQLMNFNDVEWRYQNEAQRQGCSDCNRDEEEERGKCFPHYLEETSGTWSHQPTEPHGPEVRARKPFTMRSK
jgi:hypothetical protein